ncbi:hypothetical protein [Mycobacterium nebraskense]|uniref:hypothetical protein n=1 Tax=Mycobacterium nebraskense TaxID=244292 RepID=UPI00061810C2|nr:hypothetical protein WU83_10720 [Mycobacterium nebraskense]
MIHNLLGVVLAGLILNSFFGWAWAEPIGALVLAAVAVKEGREAWRGCTPTHSADTTITGDGCGDDCCD